MTQEAWERGFATGQWYFNLNDGQADDFWGMSCVRINSVSASVVGDELAGFWKASIRPPISGAYKRLSGEKVVVEQPDVPTLFLGRVGSRKPLQYADFTGRSSFKNFSPLGQWKVTLGALSTQGEARQKVRDLELDIEVIYQDAIKDNI